MQPLPGTSPGALQVLVGGPSGPRGTQVARRARWTHGDLRALRSLVLAFPIGGRTCFRSYSVVLWPRDWRRAAARNVDGLHAGDELETVAYGAARGFPETLQVRRVSDGARHLVFPTDVEAMALDQGVVALVAGERSESEASWMRRWTGTETEPEAAWAKRWTTDAVKASAGLWHVVLDS